MSTPGDPTPALMVVGAVGVGKSDTSYHVFSRLFRAGVPTARLDLDDLGMCHPAPEGDPDNVAVKAEALGAAWRVFRAHGARCLVVSGGIDDPEVMARTQAQVPGAAWTVVQLRIGADERRRRVVRRGLLLGHTEAEMEPTVQASDEDARRIEALGLPALVLDTDGLSSDEVTDLVLARAAWPSALEAVRLSPGRPGSPPS